MPSSSVHPLGKPVSDDMTSESCRFKVICSRIKLSSWTVFPAFNIGEHLWRISCLSNEGDVKGEIGQLKFYLTYGGEWKDVKVIVELGVLKKDEPLSSINWETTTHTFQNCARGIFLKNIIRGNELKKHLKNDYFIVFCNITILKATCMGALDSGITILSSQVGTSKSHFLESKDTTPKKIMACGSFQFKIGCPHIMENKGQFLNFPIIMVGKYCFVIKYIYENDSGFSFSLTVVSETKDLKVCLEFGMLKNDVGLFSVKWMTKIYTFAKCGDFIYFKDFIKEDELEWYLEDNYFRVSCNLTILTENCSTTYDNDVTILGSTGKSKSLPLNGPPPYLYNHLSKILLNKERTDVTLEVKEELFHAHKLVLAARSPVFNVDIFGPTNENNTNNIKINEIEPEVFKAVLYFIYTDMLPDLNEISFGGNLEIDQMGSIKMFQHLLIAADRYALERLKLMCEDKLSNNITIDTVATTLILAKKHNCPNLKNDCMEFVTLPHNFMKVAVTDG